MENPDFYHLYEERDKKILKNAEDSLDPTIDRVQEIILFSREAGIKKIGIAHCVTFNRESERLESILSGEGFEVDRVSCKYGRVPFDSIVPGYRGITCNPAGQAKYLEERESELNIMMGLCLGHDMIFISKSKAPVTPLVVKDRKLNHHTVKGL